MSPTKQVQKYSETDKLNREYDYNVVERDILKQRLNKNPEIKECDIRRIILWKYDRVLNISNDVLLLLSELAQKEVSPMEEEVTPLKFVKDFIDSDFVKNLISKLIECNGIGMPVASTILKFIRPDIFPIIDVRAYRVLTGKKRVYAGKKIVEAYIKYAKEIITIAENRGIELCEVDEQLYKLDEDKNGPIKMRME